MKRVIISVIMLITMTVKGQTTDFPVGVFINSADSRYSNELRHSNYWQIEQLGVNQVIQYLDNDNKDSLSRFDKIIAINNDNSYDYIHHFTSGYYTRWEMEDTVGTDRITPGVKHYSGRNMGTYWRGKINHDTPNTYLVDGPDYDQDRFYRLMYDPFYKRNVNYIVNFRMKIAEEIGMDTTKGTNVCEISVVYRIATENSGVKDTLLAERVLTYSDLSAQFQNKTLTYTIPSTIGGYAVDEHVPEFTPPPPTNNTTARATIDYPYGVKFRVKWLGHVTLDVDYIEVYDQSIWREYMVDKPANDDSIKSYANRFNSNIQPNLAFWYSLDEPRTIDNYEPYRIVDNVLRSGGRNGLITTLHPNWDGLHNNANTTKMFIEKNLIIND